MAILIMAKYAYVKLSVKLYHKETDLSIGFKKFFEYFSKVVFKVNGQPIFSVAHLLFYAFNTLLSIPP